MRLGREAAERCLADAAMTPADVDMIVTVSCTGFMIPSLDAHLINLMGFRSRCPAASDHRTGMRRRCDGADARLGIRPGVSRKDRADRLGRTGDVDVSARRSVAGEPDFVRALRRRRGRSARHRPGRPGPRIIDADTYTFPDSLDAMGFDLRESGFHIVLSKDVPQLVRDRIRQLTDGFLARSGLGRAEVATFLLHPGGQKLLSYMQEELGLCRCDTQLSWDVLDQYGNLSSATILFILHACLTKKTAQPGQYGLAAAFGPGFSAEFLLLEWQ